MDTKQQPSRGIALITGAGRGLGRAAALHVAKAGWDVVITYRASSDLAQATVDEIRSLQRQAFMLPLDTSVVAQFEEFAQSLRTLLSREFGRTSFDALVNNAGSGLHVSFMQTTEAQFDEMLNVHLKGVFFLTQTLVPLLADGGRIINVSSGLARFSLPGMTAYAIMKGGVEVLTRYQAKELGDRGIRVNTLAPGAIATDFGGGVVRDNPQVNAFVASQTALGRAGAPDDIGAAVEALLSPATAWINGQRVEASGGMFL